MKKHKMFNEERKNKFISSIVQKGKDMRATTIFSKTSCFEEGFDFCEITDKEQLKYIIACVSGKGKNDIRDVIRILYRYCEWCIDNKIVEENYMEGISVEDIDKSVVFKYQMFPDPSGLRRYFETNLEPISDHSLITMYQLFYWLIFMGLKPEDACEVWQKDVNLKNGLLYFKGEPYAIYPQSDIVFKMAMSMNIITFSINSKAPLCNTGKLLRGLRERVTPNQYYKMGSQIYTTYGGIRLSWKNVYLSGEFYRIYSNREARGLEYNFKKLVEEKMFGKEYKAIKREYAYNHIESDFKFQYSMWKKAFDL